MCFFNVCGSYVHYFSGNLKKTNQDSRSLPRRYLARSRPTFYLFAAVVYRRAAVPHRATPSSVPRRPCRLALCPPAVRYRRAAVPSLLHYRARRAVCPPPAPQSEMSCLPSAAAALPYRRPLPCRTAFTHTPYFLLDRVCADERTGPPGAPQRPRWARTSAPSAPQQPRWARTSAREVGC